MKKRIKRIILICCFILCFICIDIINFASATESELEYETETEYIEETAIEEEPESELEYETATESEAEYIEEIVAEEEPDCELEYEVATESETECINELVGDFDNTMEFEDSLFSTNFGTSDSFYNSYLEGYITSEKNQGQTGLCSIFSHTAAAETYLMKKYPDFVETNKDANGEINLSEELLAYIRENNFDDPMHQSSKSDRRNIHYKTNVGTLDNYINALLASWGSFALEDDYPWIDDADEKEITWDKNKIVVHAKEVYYDTFIYNSTLSVDENVERFNIEFLPDIKKYIKEYGGVVFNINPNVLNATTLESLYITDEGKNYFLNNYSELEGKCFFGSCKYDSDNESINLSYQNGVDLTFHSVFCIGYDDNFPAGLFRYQPGDNPQNYRPQRNGAFMFKNSYGENKFFFVPYDLVMKKYMGYYAYEWILAENDYDNMYFLTNECDGTGYLNNDFKAVYIKYSIQGDEKIKALSYLTENALDDMCFKIFRIASGSNATYVYDHQDACLLTTKEVDIHKGLNRIELDEPVKVKNGDSVLIKLCNLNDEMFNVSIVNENTNFSEIRCYFEKDYPGFYDGDSYEFNINMMTDNYTPTIDDPAPTDELIPEEETTTSPTVDETQPTISSSSRKSSGSRGGGGGGGGGIKTNNTNSLNSFFLGSGTTNTKASAKVSSPRIPGTEKIANNLTSQWVKNDDGSWGLNSNGVSINNGFLVMTTIGTDTMITTYTTYHFDEMGKMTVGWLKDTNGDFYFFEDAKNSDEGKMCVGWKQMATGTWYCFGSDGKMLAGQITPDGYMLNSDGGWIDLSVQN